MGGYTINRLKAVLAEKRKINMTVSRWVQNKSQPLLEQLVEIVKILQVEAKNLINESKDIVTK
ncbi:MAG: transcriptional regulator [Prevotella sp.]|jgi:transcriptional regulator with XRE-family HTH domain|nr:transcriptional regulator [Prevotella sp.]MCH4183750.1 transcriptional regulator [Prevotella sp.]MCH4213275.1 transcriptional regulator [Prevotella sp.]